MRPASGGSFPLFACVVAGLLVLSAGEARLHGQLRENAPPTWTQVIDLYLSGDYAGSTALLDRFVVRGSPSETSRIVSDLRMAVVSARNDRLARSAAIGRLKAAALVPLEALLPLSARVAHDSRFDALETLLRETLHAMRALEASRVTRGEELSRFRQWADVGYMQFLLNAGKLEDAERIATGVRLPDRALDVRVQHDLLRGMVRERVARLVSGGRSTSQTYIGGDIAAGPTGPITSPAYAGGATMRASRDALARRYWSSAARWYERVLEVRPDDPEARLRLARTWLDRDVPIRALELLRPLTTFSCDTDICSLAWLFSGEAHQRLGATDAASQAYLHASSHTWTRQSALVALLHLSLQQGADAVLPLALQLRDTAPLAHDVEPDAWGIYVGGRRANIDAVLVPLRREVRP